MPLWRLPSSSEADEEGSWAMVIEPGSSIRKETDSRISARVAGRFAVAVRRAVGGGRMLPLPGVESARGRFRLLVCGAGSGGCWDWELESSCVSISTLKVSSAGRSRKAKSSSGLRSSMLCRKANFLGSSAILPTFSSASNAFRIFANSIRFLFFRASASSSESERSKSAPRFLRSMPLLMSLYSFAIAFSSLALSLSLS